MEFAAQRAQDWTQSPTTKTPERGGDLLNEGGETLVEAFYTTSSLARWIARPHGRRHQPHERLHVAQATQGLANYMLEAVPSGASIAIATTPEQQPGIRSSSSRSHGRQRH